MDNCVAKQISRVTCEKLIICAILSVCVFVSACKDSAIIWSAESQSPDKHFVASARTEQYGGLGTAGVYTTVYLKQIGQSPEAILNLSNESAYPSGITAVNMIWITPSQLSITYKGRATIEFQAVRCAGVEISIERKEW